MPVADVMLGRNFDVAAERLRAVLPDTHRAFLASLRTSYTHGGYFFCHAGVRPGVALAQQSETDLLWIREDFLGSTMDFGKIVVHGGNVPGCVEIRSAGVSV